MTTILKKAFDMALSLPQPEQERLGARWIAEMKAEQPWRQLFKSSQELPDIHIENRQLLESVNAAYGDIPEDSEEQTLRRNMRRCHKG